MEKLNIKKIIDYILIFSIFVLSIKKGGFYKTDSIGFNLVITLVGILYILIFDIFNLIRYKIKSSLKFNNQKNFKNENNDIFSFDIVELLLFCLTLAYSLPILFDNYSNLSDSIFEMIRYFNIFIIYKIVKNSDNKNIYLKGIILITAFECIVGIDGIANKYTEKFLTYFNSSFLDKDLVRLSGTIQYANLLAIMIAVSFMLVFNKLFNLEYDLKNKNKFLLYNSILLLFSISLILTETRNAMFILFVAIIAYFINKKGEKLKIKFNIFNMIIFGILSLIISNLISSSCVNNTTSVYYIAIFAMLINLIISFFIFDIFEKKIQSFESNYTFKKISLKNIFLLVFVFIGIYFFIGINISKSCYVNSEAKKNIKEFNIYNINTSNNLKINLNKFEDNTRYTIDVIEITNEFKSIDLSNINSYNGLKNNYEISFNLDDNAKYVKVLITLEAGNLTIDSMYLNSNKVNLEYILLPTNVISKIQDAFYGSTSFRDRVWYTKDALKIITNSYKNFFIGVGGEGFKNMYKSFQSNIYSSSEVHNSFLQIFVESGIIGFIIILTVIIISIKNVKDLTLKVCFIMIFIHSIFDLNMSYMFMMCIIAILIGIINNERYINLKNSYLKIFLVCLELISFGIFSKILICANIAYYIKVPLYNEENLANEEIIINTLEKKVNFDFSEIKYRKELNEEYDKYMKLLLEETNYKELEHINVQDLKIKFQNIINKKEQNNKKITQYSRE